ncbi:hypothetical protein LINPERPRIM_LOCUS8604 [Linum perenne]
MMLKCGEHSSEWQLRWSLNGAGWSMWNWIVKSSTHFWKFGYVDPGGGWVSFWDDYWGLGVRLRDLFPRVMAAATTQGSCLFHLFPNCFRVGWELPLRFALRGGALEEYYRFKAFLLQVSPQILSEGPPSLVWTPNASRGFSVHSFNAQLRKVKFPGLVNFPVNNIWSKVVPVKVQGFVWLVFHGRILTLDVLQSRGFSLPNRCSLCSKHEESVSHLFLHCPFVYPIWSKVSSRLSICGPLPLEVSDLIAGWKGLNCDERLKPISTVILHSFLWHVWLERNDMIFRDKVGSASRVYYRTIISGLGWLRVHASISQHDFELWMRQLTAT